MADTFIDPDQIAISTRHLAEAHAEADRLHRTLSDLIGAQGTDKWGTQPYPQRFLSLYSSTLTELEESTSAIRTRIEDLHHGMTRIAQAGQDVTDDSARHMIEVGQTITEPTPTPATPPYQTKR